LANDVSSPGTCFSIQADNVVLDLGGHTVTYGTGPIVTVPNGSFENGTTGWDFSQAPSASVKAGNYVNPVQVSDGGYSAAFQIAPGSAAQIIRSSPFVLPGGRTYVISGMYYNQVDANIKVTMEIDDASTGVTLSSLTYSGTTNRGFLLAYPNSVAVPSTTTVTYKLTVDGSASTHSGTVYWDDVRVQVGPAYGVAAIKCWDTALLKRTVWSGTVTSDAPCGGTASNLVIKNGSIVQGAGAPFEGHAIVLGQSMGANAEIANLSIQLNAGPKSAAIFGGSALYIHNNTITSAVKVIERRDGFEGYVLRMENSGSNTRIVSNTISGGAQGEITFSGTGSGSTVSSNNLSGQATFYTNDFAIQIYGGNMTNGEVANNIINHMGRGIYVGGGATGWSVHDNDVSVQALALNQEYNGCEIGGAYGIQLEHGTNNVVYNNVVKANADQCNATAMRFTGILSGDVLSVHDNKFTSARIGSTSARADGVSIGENSDGSNTTIKNNTFTADSADIYDYWSAMANFTFISNTFIKGSNAASTFAMFVGANASPSLGNSIVDGIFQNGASTSSASFYCIGTGCGQSGWQAATEYFVKWTIGVKTVDSLGNLVPGSSVTIKDKTGATVFSGTTDSSGFASATITEAHIYNTTTSPKIVDNFNPFTVTATGTAGSGSTSLSIDSSQTVTVTLE
jgi:hypothetical protein